MMVKDELEKVKEWHRRCAVSRRGRRGAIVEVIWIMCFCFREVISTLHVPLLRHSFIITYLINGQYWKSVPSILWLPWKLAPHSPGLKLSVQNSTRFWWLGDDEADSLVRIYTVFSLAYLPWIAMMTKITMKNAVSVLRCCRLIAVVSSGLTFYMLIKIDFWN